MTRTAHSREAEAQADHSALVMLTTARVDGAGMARFFEKLAKLDGSGESWMRYLSTHPPTEERAARARATARGGAPALTAEEWKSLRAICDRKEPPPGRRFRPN
jgi:predicted Zn-dependent protease